VDSVDVLKKSQFPPPFCMTEFPELTVSPCSIFLIAGSW